MTEEEPILIIRWDGHEEQVSLEASQDLLLGKSASANIVLDHPTVSTTHARIYKRDDGWWIDDLRGNRDGEGTYVNGQRVDTVPLSLGDIILLGAVTITFIASGQCADSQLTIELTDSTVRTFEQWLLRVRESEYNSGTPSQLSDTISDGPLLPEAPAPKKPPAPKK
nr:FHA domain-containing protein [Myxococcales bacterium]